MTSEKAELRSSTRTTYWGTCEACDEAWQALIDAATTPEDHAGVRNFYLEHLTDIERDYEDDFELVESIIKAHNRKYHS